MLQATLCKISGKPFTVTSRDLEFYAKIGVPPPQLCPEERRRRRFMFRNERALFKQKSSLSGKEFISNINPKDPWKVISPEEWWSDSFDATVHGRPYDFSKFFFQQFDELQKIVPAMGIMCAFNENSPYANYAASCKNCHLIFGSVYCEDCLYGNPYYSKSCIDSLLVRDSELCYECVTCEKCYECFFCQDCANSYSLIFCYDCHGSRNCIGCVGLRNKEYYIFNKPVSKEEFEKKKRELDLCDAEKSALLRREFEALKLAYPRRASLMLNTENCTGDYVYTSKNSFECFDVQRCEDTSYCAQVIDMKDCYDCNYMEECELCYEYICNYKNTRIFFSNWLHNSHDCWYSAYCVRSSNLFGCVGLKDKQYCILNKTYERSEYEKLRGQIIEYMKKTGEWGEFFPPSLSLFCYNETVAQEYFPLTQEEAATRGYRWREKDPKEYRPQTAQVSQNIAHVPDSITSEILACEATGRARASGSRGSREASLSNNCAKNFRIEVPEFKFYKRFRIPIPQNCPDCRHQGRLALRNPRLLFERKCEQCAARIETTYAPDRPEKVLCEACYLKAIY